jgi:hypothetical protein
MTPCATSTTPGSSAIGLVVSQVSRTASDTQVVDEVILSFTHDREMPALLPGIKADRRKVEIPARQGARLPAGLRRRGGLGRGRDVDPGAVEPAAARQPPQRKRPLDRIDLQIEVPAVSAADIRGECGGSRPRRRRTPHPGRAACSTAPSQSAHQCRLRRQPARGDRSSRSGRMHATPRGGQCALAQRPRLSPDSSRCPHACRSRRRGARGAHSSRRDAELSRETLRRAQAAA